MFGLFSNEYNLKVEDTSDDLDDVGGDDAIDLDDGSSDNDIVQ